MESDDFGPMTSAVEDVTTMSESVLFNVEEDVRAELGRAEKHVAELLRQKTVSELAFGQQRAKFMELFRHEEDKLRRTQEQLVAANKLNGELKDQLWRQSAELDDVKTAAAVSEATKLDEIDNVRRHCEEEVATLQRLMQEDLQSRWKKEEEKLQVEISDLRAKLNQERDGFLGSLTKTLQKKITAGATRDEQPQESIDLDMKKAQEDAELLRSVVQPLEDEILSLRNQLRVAQEQSHRDNDGSSTTIVSEVEDKVKALQENFIREKSSRTDLEMYVAVLNTQKGVLQEDLDKLRAQLIDVCQLLEEEKVENSCLRKLWQLTSDRASVVNALKLALLKSAESLLTDDQRQQLTSVKLGKGSTVEEMQLQELSDAIEQEELQLKNRKALREQLVKSADSSGHHSSDASDGQSHYRPLPNVANGLHRPTTSIVSGQENVTSRWYTLTNAQQESLVAPTLESQASEALMTVAKTESLSAVGMRLITEQDFSKLQIELNAAKEAASRQCDKCVINQERLDVLVKQCNTLEKNLSDSKLKSQELVKYIEELETNLKDVALKASTQISTLNNKLQDSMRFLANAREQFVLDQKSVLQHIALTARQRTELQTGLEKIRTENDLLVGKWSKHARELQEEVINLPNSMEDMQLLLLTYREDLIAAKVAQERASELLSSELELVRSQADEERQREQAERQHFRMEFTKLQEQLAIQSSICSELERERAEVSSSVNVDIRLKQTIANLQQRLQQQQSINKALEQELYNLRLASGATFQGNPVNAPRPQQPLPARFPRSDFGEECPSCRQRFSNTLPKVLCQQCRGVYCSRCVSKTVVYGPNVAPSSVCDSCYSMHFSYYR